ncbi:hypothetical protein LCGC14_0313160 [marine sediment metagenome]|uniref:Uncharacterized protein n=1 Tax=marine sediment metagenome TaxID=412755 RepID=A0A0F9TRT8_9ZZZZ
MIDSQKVISSLEAERDSLQRTNGRLMEALEERRYNYRHFARALQKIPMVDGRRLEAINAVCEVLQADNPRFQAGLFMDWALSDV